MNRVLAQLLLVLFGLSPVAMGGWSQTPAVSDDHTAASYDMKAQALQDLGGVQKKFVDLANALPVDKFTWRPSADSRSFAEVFLHVAGERYQILALGGAVPPAGFDGKTFEKSTTDKAAIVPELNKSWHFPQTTITRTTTPDLTNLLPHLAPH